MAQAFAQVTVRMSAEELALLDRAVAETRETRNAIMRRLALEWAHAHQPAAEGEKNGRETQK